MARVRAGGFVPDFGAPPEVAAWMSTRDGGVSTGPWSSLNLGTAVGDDAAAVRENRARFACALEGARPVFLRQVHGTRVVRLHHEDTVADAVPLEADAAVTTQPGIACTVQVADCLPVLLAAPQGRAVAAAHAGWRGLAGGVVEATLASLCAAAACEPGDVVAWLGPCIGPTAFEVGADVRAAFAGAQAAFADARRADGTPCWLADLPRLARERLQAQGVHRVAGGAGCTVGEASRFFSFRRDGVTGRMAAAIWVRG